MSKDINSQSQRLDELLDFRIGDLKEDIKETKNSVIRIEKMLVGNGSEGLISKVSKNSANMKIVLWVLSIIVGGALTASFCLVESQAKSADNIQDIQFQFQDIQEVIKEMGR